VVRKDRLTTEAPKVREQCFRSTSNSEDDFHAGRILGHRRILECLNHDNEGINNFGLNAFAHSRLER